MAIQFIISLLLLIFFLLFSVGMRPTQQSLLTSVTMVMLVKSGKYVAYLFMQILPSVCNSLCQEYYWFILPPSSETQGQTMGARESLNGWKNMARRKVKNGEKSPWGQCFTRPVLNGRRRSAFWLGRKTQTFSGTNQKGLTVLYFHLCYIFPPVQTFPLSHYLPLGLRGCPSPFKQSWLLLASANKTVTLISPIKKSLTNPRLSDTTLFGRCWEKSCQWILESLIYDHHHLMQVNVTQLFWLLVWNFPSWLWNNHLFLFSSLLWVQPGYFRSMQPWHDNQFVFPYLLINIKVFYLFTAQVQY